MAVWGEKVWGARPVSFFDRTSLLIFDSFSAQLTREFATTIAVIPGGLAKKPLNVSII